MGITARAGSTEARYGPIGEVAWDSGNSGDKTHEVALKRPNAWSLYDTLANVWEWVNDWYDPTYYQNSPPQDPFGPASGKEHILRGGSWYVGPGLIRLSNRYGQNPAYRNYNVGFRCGGVVFAP